VSIYGILFACPVCPSASAFGFTRLTLWGVALILSSVLLLAPSRYARAQAAALCALELDPPVFSALNLDSNAPPFVFRFEGGKVVFSKPLSASQSLLEQYPAEQPTDLGARAESSARAQSSKNPNKEETQK